MNKSLIKGFSLVELLVAMAIIAVLISIAVFGIQIVQRNSRNMRRISLNENLKLALNDFQSNNQTYAGWITYNNSTQNIEVKKNQNDLTLGVTIPVKGFNHVEVYTSDLCSESNDNNGYGKPETHPESIWICYNPTKLIHGVRIENGINQLVQQFNGSNFNSSSSRWTKQGDSMLTYWSNEWLSYNSNISESGSYNLEIEAINRGIVPPGYNNFRVQVMIDNNAIGIVDIPANQQNYNRGSISIQNLSSGNHTIQVKWINDRCDGNGIDANIQIKNIALTK